MAKPRSPQTGILCLNKPKGVTSRDVVNHVQRVTGIDRCGHAGTLDPLATGVMVVCIGQATRLIPFIQEYSKRYHATFLLGRSSPTDDVEGDVTLPADAPIPTREELEAILPRFVGRIMQRPPVYSAIKIEGQRGYEWARQGSPKQPLPRPVEVFELELLRYDYPEWDLAIHCGSGTYVRSLGRDIAGELQTSAVMSALTRTAVGPFRLENAVMPDQLTPANWQDHLLPLALTVQYLPKLVLSDEEIRRLHHGQWLELSGELKPGERAAVLNQNGELVAVVQGESDGRLRPLLNFRLAVES